MATQHSASSLDEKASFKGEANASVEAVDQKKGVDVTVDLVRGHAEDELTREQFRRIRAKLDWHLLPLIFLLYTLQFIDKNSLGSVAILGLMTDNHLNTDQFNNLGSAFYIGYIIFVYPHSWMMQRFPIAKWISLNIFLWSVFLGLHCVCHNYGGLFVLRFLLGAAEGCITTGCMTVTSMFYDRTEVSERLAWTFQCNGFASIIANCVAFGIAHISPTMKPARWQWYMIFTSIISVITSVLFFLFFPDNPATARFLTPEEKMMVVQRLKSTQNGIETKVWKKYQFIEAIKDVKTWLFFLFAAISNLQGGLGIQYQIIIKGFGFNTLQTTMLSIPMGFTMIFAITASTIWLHKFPNHRAWIGVAFFIPSIVACICLLALPQSNRGGLLAQIYIINMNGAGFIAILGWVAVSFAGHTKKMTVNAIFLVGYALGQALCTQFWKLQYRPRNVVPWSIQVSTYVIDIILILIMRYLLVKENKRRDAEQEASGEQPEQFGYVEKTSDEGVTEKIKVPIQLLDITDKENRAFRYPL